MSDSIDLLLGALRSGGALALLLVLPGLTLGRLVAPGAASRLGLLGRAAGVSLLTTSVACTVLAAIGQLSPASVVGFCVLATVAPLLVGERRRPRPTRRTVTVAGWLPSVAGIAAIVLLLVAPSAAAVADTGIPFTSTVWYYGALSDRVAQLGGVPATFPEWGAERPFHTDYLPFTAHAAAAFQLLPGDLMARMEAYRLGLLASAALVASLVLRRWVSTWQAVLGAILLLATERLAFKFLAFKPETFGLTIALFALWAFDRAIVERSRRLAGVAVAAGSLTFLAHAEVFLVLVAASVALAAARLFVRPGHGGHVGLQWPRSDRLLRIAALAAAVVVGSAVLATAANGVIAGELRLIGYVTADRSGAAAPREPGPAGWTFTDDPTWDFYVAAVAPGQLGREAPSSFIDARLLPRAIAHVWPGLDGRNPSLLVVLVALLAVLPVSWPWLDARRRRLALVAVAFGVILLVGSWLLFAISDTYVPRRIGPRRLMPYELLVPVIAAMVVLWWIERLLRPGWRALLGGDRPTRAPALASAVLLALLTAGMIAPAPTTGEDDAEPRGRLSPVGLEAWSWIAANTPPDARVLVNAYTDGVAAGLGRRVGILDGRAVYLEDREFLAESTASLLGARRLFLDPGGPDAVGYLSRHRATYLLVADGGVGADGSDVGGYRPFATDIDALASGGRYTLLRSFGGGRVLLYEVAAAG